MRTTLTLEEDVNIMLRRLARRRGISFKTAINTALRQGLLALDQPARPRPYRTQPRSLGTRPGIDYDKVGQLADELADTATLVREKPRRRR